VTRPRPYAAIKADPEVMRYFPSTVSREASDRFIDWASGLITERGWGLWAVEVVGGPPFVGVAGLNETRHVADAVEVSWKLAREHWGYGYATEAAREALPARPERDRRDDGPGQQAVAARDGATRDDP
jgi:RimJ/RimL family protein N-acetyltransferase